MHIEHIFPFEWVPRDADIVLYGLGTVGRLYLHQIRLTKWCNVIAASDSSEENRRQFDWPGLNIVHPKEINNYGPGAYFVVAVEAIDAVNAIYRFLLEQGVPSDRIVNFNQRNGLFPFKVREHTSEEPLYFALKCRGGLGDHIVVSVIYERLIQLYPDLIFDIYGKRAFSEAVFGGKKGIRRFLAEEELAEYRDTYDAILDLDHFVGIDYCDFEYVKEQSDPIYQLLLASKRDPFVLGVPEHEGRYLAVLELARLVSTDRYGMLGHRGLWSLSPSMVQLPLDEKYEAVFQEYHLKRFFTFSCESDRTMRKAQNGQVKEWPIEYYQELVAKLKCRYPDCRMVQLGNSDMEEVKGADLYIKGQSLELIKYFLKNSLLHISSEGGLVHMATALGTTCAVLFGPTPVDYYGYPENINISSGVCKGCFYASPTWHVSCLLGDKQPRCMYCLKPDHVLAKISAFMDKS
jgi:ADP-heptose:LPS heptosyltransferase